jgi:predicted thioesterase
MLEPQFNNPWSHLHVTWQLEECSTGVRSSFQVQMSEHADAVRNTVVVEVQIKRMALTAPGKHVTVKAGSAGVTIGHGHI